MKTRSILCAACMLLMFTSCRKAVNALKDSVSKSANYSFVDYYIAKGVHTSDPNAYRRISTSELKFAVQFDNSAIYQAANTANQQDINKLYGFSDNNLAHHISSARIGWRWYNNQLQLFAYVYNNSTESDKFIASVPLNQEIACSIRTEGTAYVFTVGDAQVSMPRSATTTQAEGYLLYPYFGGDEVAPQDIHINIKDM